MEKFLLNVEEKFVYDFFVVYMDIDIINEKGIELIKDVFMFIDSIENKIDLIKVFGNSWLVGLIMLIGGGMWYNCFDLNEY